MLDTIFLSGLTEIYTDLTSNWIGPTFLIAVAAFSIYFIKNRQFRELGGFLAISAIVGVLVYAGSSLFGSGGTATKATSNLAKKVANTNIIQIDNYK